MNFQRVRRQRSEDGYSISTHSELTEQSEEGPKMVSISQDILIEILEENKMLKNKVAKLEDSLKQIKNFSIINDKFKASHKIPYENAKKINKARRAVQDENLRPFDVISNILISLLMKILCCHPR